MVVTTTTDSEPSGYRLFEGHVKQSFSSDTPCDQVAAAAHDQWTSISQSEKDFWMFRASERNGGEGTDNGYREADGLPSDV